MPRNHRGFEIVNRFRRDALVLGAEVAEDGGVDFRELGFVGGQDAVVDGDGLEGWGGDGQLCGVTSAHAPTDCADGAALHILASFEKVDRRDKIANALTLRKAAHELVGGFRIAGDFASVEIDGEGNVQEVLEE